MLMIDPPRLSFIAGIAGGGIAAASAAPALAQGQRRLKLVTDRPEAALRLAARVGAASGGRLALDVAPLPEGAGPLMRAAVAAGVMHLSRLDDTIARISASNANYFETADR